MARYEKTGVVPSETPLYLMLRSPGWVNYPQKVDGTRVIFLRGPLNIREQIDLFIKLIKLLITRSN